MSTLMVQGTTSDAGKSTLVTALCRWLVRQGIAVAPFKPQNMALNSAVTAEGGEIGRAQAVQAQAANLAPHTDMNPVLLKPNSDTGSQVIIHGRAVTSMNAVAYHDYKAIAMQAVLASHTRLSAAYPVVMVEGAGSPAEINLRANDIANMGFAEAVDCPVLLIADINRGGVFAHLVGTLELLAPTEQARVKGFIINRFRGDIALLQPGLDWLEARTGKPVVGVEGASIPDPVRTFPRNWDIETNMDDGPVEIMKVGVLSGEVGQSICKPFGNIHFVGAQTASVWRGHMEGAVRSGIRGAKEVIAGLRKERRSRVRARL